MAPKSLKYSRSCCCLPLSYVSLLVVRKNDHREEYFGLVGECHLHDIMKGDAFEFDNTNATEFSPW
jgi:hypothetical protein